GADSRKIAEQIRQAAGKALEPLDRTRRFGNLALLVASDSNVLAMPETDSGATGTSTIKTLAQASLGLITSPLRRFQLAPNFRASLPFHLSNRETTRIGEYTHYALTVPVTYNPL